MKRPRTSSPGFTLIEALAALTIAAAVLTAAASLVRSIGGGFDRGLIRAAEAERTILAADRLARDFAAARFVTVREGDRVRAVFTGSPESVTFVSGAAPAATGGGEEVVTLTVERQETLTRLVRRRAVFTGAAAAVADLAPVAPVTLLEGAFDLVLAYGAEDGTGTLAWSETWLAQPRLPGFVRVLALDRSSGEDRLGGLVLVVRADAPAACVQDRPDPGCLTAGADTAARGTQR